MGSLRVVVLLAAVVSGGAWAAECEEVRERPLGPLLEATALDEALAQSFEKTAAACTRPPAVCDEDRRSCATVLADTARRQATVDEGAWLRDMLVPFSGQYYRPQVSIPAAGLTVDQPCQGPAAGLIAAAQKRRAQVERRKLLAAEYPRWAAWAREQRTRCLTAVEEQKKRDLATAATAANLAAATAAAKATEDARAQQLAAEAKLRVEQERAQREALVSAQRARDQQAEAAAQALAAAEAERADQQKKKEREQARAEEEKVVVEREAKKQAARDRVAQLKEEQAASEALAAKKLAEAPDIDDSDERSRGALAAHFMGGLATLGASASGVIGGQVRLRHAFWFTAPASGMAAGLELRGLATFLSSVAGREAPYFVQLIHLTPEVRYWFGRLGLGVVFQWEQSVSGAFAPAAGGVVGPSQTVQRLGLGPSLSFAALDRPGSRILFSARWLPLLANALDAVAGEVELGLKWFSVSVLAGTLRQANGADARTGWFVSAGLGGRLRW